MWGVGSASAFARSIWQPNFKHSNNKVSEPNSVQYSTPSDCIEIKSIMVTTEKAASLQQNTQKIQLNCTHKCILCSTQLCFMRQLELAHTECHTTPNHKQEPRHYEIGQGNIIPWGVIYMRISIFFIRKVVYEYHQCYSKSPDNIQRL